jgi:hypothetical protein
MLGRDEPPVSNSKILEEIRTVMLATLENHSGPGQVRLETQIAFAADLAELWQLCPAIMQSISSVSGEKFAERELQKISRLFKGHYPASE